MPLIKAPLKPGINREIPEYANEGGFDYSNLIRFRMGYAEKLGGWANTNYYANPSSPASFTFNGVVRSIINWVTSASESLLGIGTTQQYFVQNGVGTQYHDISPQAYTTTVKGSAFYSNGTVSNPSPVIRVLNDQTIARAFFITPTIANGGLDVGSMVYFYSSGLYADLYMTDSLGNPSFAILLADGVTTIAVGGTTPDLNINGVIINAHNSAESINSVPYPVVAVDRQTLTNLTISYSAGTVTIVGSTSTSTVPVAGTTIQIVGCAVSVYNGAHVVASAYLNINNPQIITITYSATISPSPSGASSGIVTWVNSFDVIGTGTATTAGASTVSGVTALDVVVTNLPNFGNSTNVYSLTSSTNYSNRVWSQAAFNDDLIFAIQGGPLYYWVKDTTNWTPATTLAAYANTQQYQQANVTSTASSSTTFNVDFNDYIFPGQTISIASGSGTVPAGTKVVSISGLTVTVSQAVTVYKGGELLGTLTGGTGYAGSTSAFPVTYGGVVFSTSGAGTGAVGNVTVGTGGVITAVTFTSLGSGYLATNTLTAPQTTGKSWLGGGNIVTPATDQGNYTIANTTYFNQPMIYVSGGGTGSGMIANITVDNSGHVNTAGVVIVNPGTGYLVGDVLTCPNLGSGTIFKYTLGNGNTTPSGFSCTLSSNTVAATATTLNLSYSGQYVPTTTNKLFYSPIYQFVVALGANPYDPTNPTSTFNPMLVRWSDQANPSQWIPQAANQAGEQPLGYGSKLVTAVANLQAILVFSDTAVYQMQYVGAPFVFSFTLLQNNISIISQNAAITANNATWWMGTDKFYVFNGSTQVLPCPIRRFVYSNINAAQAWQVVVGYNEGFNEVWWFYPSTNSTANDSYVKYNFAENLWDYGSLNRTAWLDVGVQPYPLGALSVQTTYIIPTTAYPTTVSASATTISVADTSSFPSSGVLQIDTEKMVYTAKTATTFTVVRSSGTTHSVYAAVSLATPNQLVYHEYGVDDYTVPNIRLPVLGFLQSSDFGIAEGEKMVSVNKIIPDLTFVNSTGSSPTITVTAYPRVNPGSAYQVPPAYGVDQPTITSTVLPSETTPLPEQYTGQPSKSVSLLTAGQGQIYTRVRGRTVALRFDTGDATTLTTISGYPVQVPANSIGTMWQLGLLRLEVRPDGKR